LINWPTTIKGTARWCEVGGNRGDEARWSYTHDGGVIGNAWRFRLCVLLLLFLRDADILHITASEDNVFIDTGGRRDLIARTAPSPFRAK
jgi:hypothetical protein